LFDRLDGADHGIEVGGVRQLEIEAQSFENPVRKPVCVEHATMFT